MYRALSIIGLGLAAGVAASVQQVASPAFRAVSRPKPGHRKPRAVMVDEEGRQRILRGINLLNYPWQRVAIRSGKVRGALPRR